MPDYFEKPRQEWHSNLQHGGAGDTQASQGNHWNEGSLWGGTEVFHSILFSSANNFEKIGNSFGE